MLQHKQDTCETVLLENGADLVPCMPIVPACKYPDCLCPGCHGNPRV